METVNSNDLFDEKKLSVVVGGLVVLNKSVLVFGLHGSGKSTLVKAVCGADKRFKTLDEEEVLSDEDDLKLREESGGLWCVGHQFPSQDQSVSNDYLLGFVEGMGLNLKEWVIVKIVK